MRTTMNKLNDKSNISQIINYKDKVITDQKDITNAFCEYFTNVGQEYANNIPITNKQPEMYMNNQEKHNVSKSY